MYLDEMVNAYAKMIMDRAPYGFFVTVTFDDVYHDPEQANKRFDRLISEIEKNKVKIAYVKVIEYEKLGSKKSKRSKVCLKGKFVN